MSADEIAEREAAVRKAAGALAAAVARHEMPELEQIVYEEVFKPDSAGKGTIPAQYFTKAGKWAVGVNAYSGNGWTRYAGGYVTVEENSDRPEAPHIEMLTENPRMNEPVLFRIETKGAEKVCARLLQTMS